MFHSRSDRRRNPGKDSAGAFYGHALFVEQRADLPQYLHIPFGIKSLALGGADRLKLRKFSFPEAKHAGLKRQFSGGFTDAVHTPGLRFFSVHISVLGLRAEEMAL